MNHTRPAHWPKPPPNEATGGRTIISTIRRIRKAWPIAALSLASIFLAANDTFAPNPAQRAAFQYRYSITAWEFQNLPDKWLHKLTSLLPWNRKTDAEKLDDLVRYFTLGRELATANAALNRSMSNRTADETARLHAEVDRIAAERMSIRDGAEETMESAISAVVQEIGLGWRADIVFPPVDIRLGSAPAVLLTSPRSRIERQHEALLEPGVTLAVRERLENQLMAQDDSTSAGTFQISGLATYPASVLDTIPLADAFRVAGHEWTHHYMAFRPLGRKMFTAPEMVALNETTADIIGRELGDRAREFLFGGSEPPPIPIPPPPAPAGDTAERQEHFDFTAEMRTTRLRVDDLLSEGKVDDAEEYMEERRRLFVRNGFPIRRLNQAYFAFHGTYAGSAASSSPIGGQLSRFRELTPDLRAFVVEMSQIGSYQQFLDELRAWESESEAKDANTAGSSHPIARPIASPPNAANSPTATLAPRFSPARPRSPASTPWVTATASVENVVYDPRNPTAKNNLYSNGKSGRDSQSPNSTPKSKDPVTLAANVPTKGDPMNFTTARFTAWRATAPSAPPPATNTHSSTNVPPNIDARPERGRQCRRLSDHILRTWNAPRTPRVALGSRPQGASQRLEDRLGLMVIVGAVQQPNMKVELPLMSEALQEVPDQAPRKPSEIRFPNVRVDHRIPTPSEIDRSKRKRLIERNEGVCSAGYPPCVTKRLPHSPAQGNRSVLDQVMPTHVRIPLRRNLQIDQPMPRNLSKQMIEHPAARLDTVFTRPVEIDRNRNPRLGCLA